MFDLFQVIPPSLLPSCTNLQTMTLQGNLDTLPVLPSTVHPDVSLLAASAPPPLFREMPDGKYMPYILPQPGPLLSAVLKPPPIPLNCKQPLPPLPREDTLEPQEIKWDGWPNRYFAQNYDQDMLDETGDLHVHWACKNTCGDWKGLCLQHHGKLGGKALTNAWVFSNVITKIVK
jgi:hypothetical protein